MARISRNGQFYHSRRFEPQVDCTITLEPPNLLLSSVGRGVVPRREAGVTLRDSPTVMLDFVLPRPSRFLGGSGHTRSYRDRVRAASLQVPLLSNTVAGSVSTTRCVWPVFAISAYAGVTVSTITVRVYSIEPGPVMVTSIGS